MVCYYIPALKRSFRAGFFPREYSNPREIIPRGRAGGSYPRSSVPSSGPPFPGPRLSHRDRMGAPPPPWMGERGSASAVSGDLPAVPPRGAWALGGDGPGGKAFRGILGRSCQAGGRDTRNIVTLLYSVSFSGRPSEIPEDGSPGFTPRNIVTLLYSDPWPAGGSLASWVVSSSEYSNPREIKKAGRSPGRPGPSPCIWFRVPIDKGGTP